MRREGGLERHRADRALEAAGRLVEQGRPHKLLSDPSSELAGMARPLGDAAVAKLKEKAAQARQWP